MWKLCKFSFLLLLTPVEGRRERDLGYYIGIRFLVGIKKNIENKK